MIVFITFYKFSVTDTSIYLNDGTFTIFLTPLGTKNDVSDKLKAFLNFAAGKITSDDPFIGKLERRVKEVKQNADWRMEYMTLLLRDQENIRKGKKEERSEVMNLVTSLLKVNGVMSAEGAEEFGKLVISKLPVLK